MKHIRFISFVNIAVATAGAVVCLSSSTYYILQINANFIAFIGIEKIGDLADSYIFSKMSAFLVVFMQLTTIIYSMLITRLTLPGLISGDRDEHRISLMFQSWIVLGSFTAIDIITRYLI